MSSTRDTLLTQAFADLVTPLSLTELEHRLDRWLNELYRVLSWTISYRVDGIAEAELRLHTSVADLASAQSPVPTTVQVSASGIHGVMELAIADGHFAEEYETELRLLATVIGTSLNHLWTELRLLTHTAEMSLFHSLLHRETLTQSSPDLDLLAAGWLQHLNVSSLQVLVLGQGPTSMAMWGVSSRRVHLPSAIEDGQNLAKLIKVVLSPQSTASSVVIAHGNDLRRMQHEFNLAYLGSLQSILIVPMYHGALLLGAVIAGEQRSWPRQAFGLQTLTTCQVLAQALAGSVSRSQLLGTLLERDRFLNTILDALDDGVVTTREERIVSWNAAAQRLFGYSAGEVVGKLLSEVLRSLPVAAVENTDGVVDGSRRTFEWKVQTLGGRDLTLSCTVVPLHTFEQDTPTQMYVFYDMAPHLEVEYLKDEVLSSVSHELKLPLNGINGFGRLLVERPHMSDRMRREALETLQSSIERLNRLASDFIDVARARRQSLPVELEPLALPEIIRMAVRELRHRYPTHVLRVSIARRVPMVCVDSLRIKQIVDNLVSNAVKYSPEGTKISLDMYVEGAMVALRVSDRGEGIPTHMVERIFEPFYRAERSWKERPGSVGLGLSIVKSLVDAHHGQIRVCSRRGGGTTFTITLPVADRSDQTALSDENGSVPTNFHSTRE